MKFHGNIWTKLNHKQTKHSETKFNKQKPTQIKCKHFETCKQKSGFGPFSKHLCWTPSSPLRLLFTVYDHAALWIRKKTKVKASLKKKKKKLLFERSVVAPLYGIYYYAFLVAVAVVAVIVVVVNVLCPIQLLSKEKRKKQKRSFSLPH